MDPNVCWCLRRKGGLGPLWAGETRLLCGGGGGRLVHQSEGRRLVRGGQRTRLIPPAWKTQACLFRSLWIFMTPEKLVEAPPAVLHLFTP